MSHAQDYVMVNNPNIPVLSPSCFENIPIGQLIESPVDECNAFGNSVSYFQSHDLYLPNFSLRTYAGEYKRDAHLYNRTNEGVDLLGSCLFLKGKVGSFLPKHDRIVEGSGGQQNFKYDPFNEYTHVIHANIPFHILHFSYTKNYLNQILPENERWADMLQNKIARQERIMGEQAAPISLAQEQAIQTLFDCPLAGRLGLVMRETAVTQIILLQLHSLFHVPEKKKWPISSDQRDVDMIHELKAYLQRTFLEDHCMQSLARQFGTNTNKLMMLFRKVFGKSIFGFIGELRMEHARELLREKDWRVGEVARTVGYKNANHFSTAFKRKYGVIPSEYK